MSAFLLALDAGAQSSSGKWTLKECIDYAMANNITLQKSKLTKQSSVEDFKQSKAALFPSLNFSTTHSIGYRPWVNSGTSTVTNGTVATSIDKFYYNGSYGINASWTVWNGNQNRNTIKQNKLAVQQAELDSITSANSIQEQIVQLYVQILYTNEAISVNQQSYEISVKNEERGKVMLEVGKMSKADVAQLTAQVAEDQYNVVEAKATLANYKLQLKQLLEITNETEFDVQIPETSDEQALEDIPSLMSVYEAAVATRPEIENSKLAIQSSDLSIAIAKAGYLPTISLSGSVGTSTSSMSDFGWGTQMKTNFDAGIGASVSVPIFDNRSAKTAVNKAKIEREQSLLDLKDKQKELYSTIEGYWQDAYTNQAKYKAAKASVESAQASYDLLSEQFRLGLKNIVELMTGKTNLLTAQQNKLQSKYTTILDQQLLKFYKGESIDM
ncbi:MAG: TolC family protein [Prevotellaceae bacterium]|nr:TolC family protein [Prevotellaceae bacterium]